MKREEKHYNFKLLATVLDEETIRKLLLRDAIEFKTATQNSKHEVGKTIRQRNGQKEKLFALSKDRLIFWKNQSKYLNFKEETKEEFGELTEQDKKEILRIIKKHTTHLVVVEFEENKLKISRKNPYGFDYDSLIQKEKEHLKKNFRGSHSGNFYRNNS